jgi:Putative  PD-(D/E)XK family member, (DUF4420)
VITEQDWTRLNSDWHESGTTIRLVYPQSPHEIYIAVQHPDGTRMLTISVSAQAFADALRLVRELPHTQGLLMQFARQDDHGQLRVTLTDPDLREVFNPLASDIAATAHAESNATEAVVAAVRRFEHWRQMLQSLSGSGLSVQERRGLFGELSFLRDHLRPVLPAIEAVGAWTGPTGAHQDFQLRRVAIEVKTSSGKEPQTIAISSERELDETGTGLLVLAHFSLDERRGGSGESLNAIVDQTRGLVDDPVAREALNASLVRAGYLPGQRDLYDEPRYTIRRQRFWHVVGDFPRITESDLRPGVGDCEYRISVAGLEQYAMLDEDVLSAVLEGSPR